MIFHSKLSRIGFINKLNGFAGEVVLIAESSNFKSVSKSKFLFVKIDGIAAPFAVENIFEKGGKIIVKFEGSNNADYAKRFLNNEVLIESKKSSKIKVEFSWKDLAGFELIDSDYGSLGKIETVEKYPQQILAKCLIKEKEVLIPLHDDLMDNIDMDTKQIFVTLPDGLMDI